MTPSHKRTNSSHLLTPASVKAIGEMLLSLGHRQEEVTSGDKNHRQCSPVSSCPWQLGLLGSLGFSLLSPVLLSRAAWNEQNSQAAVLRSVALSW